MNSCDSHCYMMAFGSLADADQGYYAIPVEISRNYMSWLDKRLNKNSSASLSMNDCRFGRKQRSSL